VYRWVFTPVIGTAGSMSLTPKDLLRMLMARASATNAVQLFTAFKLHSITVRRTGAFSSPSVGFNFAWNPIAGDENVKPEEKVADQSGTAQPLMARLVPPANSRIGFWRDDVTNANALAFLMVPADATADGTQYVIDVDISHTMPTATDQTGSVIGVTSIPFDVCQVLPPVVGGGSVVARGYTGYTP